MQLADYSAGSLSWWRTRSLKAHLHQCPHCQKEWQRFQQVMAVLKTLPDKDPPEGTWLMVQQRARARESQPLGHWSRVRVAPMLAYGATAVALLMVGVATWSVYGNRPSSPLVAQRVRPLPSSRSFPSVVQGNLFSAAPVTSDEPVRAVTAQEIERVAEVKPQQPQFVPDGYKFDGYALYRCHCCDCGQCAAILRYRDGDKRLWVLEGRADLSDCEGASHAPGASAVSPCLLCRMGKGNMAEVKLPSMRVAVTGNLSEQSLLAVANSVRKK
jgi:anti-sigma factor RsiW